MPNSNSRNSEFLGENLGSGEETVSLWNVPRLDARGAEKRGILSVGERVDFAF